MRLLLSQALISCISVNVSMYIPKKVQLTYRQQQEMYSEEFEDDHVCIYSKDIHKDSLYEFFMYMCALEKAIAPMFYTNIDQVFGEVAFIYYGKQLTLPYRHFMKLVRREYA